MPKIGFGTYRVQPGEQTRRAVAAALEAGYRMVDTAQVYKNERDVGQAIRDSGLPRESVFVATKVWDDSHGFEDAQRAGRASVEQLGLEYTDLLLMHSPGQRMVETYDALLRLREAGVTRSVGVANFGIKHLEALRRSGRPPPAVNQIEMHPIVYPEREALVEYCRRHGILVQAYGSLLSGKEAALAHGALVELAAALGRPVGQVLLQWGLSRGFQVIPKSIDPIRMKENLGALGVALSSEEASGLEDAMQDIGSLGVYWNPVDRAPVDLGENRQLEAALLGSMPSWGPVDPADLLELPDSVLADAAREANRATNEREAKQTASDLLETLVPVGGLLTLVFFAAVVKVLFFL
ncbi:unnamed protein product [Prorocentrum cordatum]|nr:unnamed protein product [Polarella glacialis]